MKHSSRRLDGYKLTWLRDGRRFLFLLLLVFLVLRFLIGISTIQGDSMRNTLFDKDIVLFLRVDHSYKLGDIVALQVPSGEHYVKRIVAADGDTIDLRDGIVYVNDTALDEPYAISPTEPEGNSLQYPLTLNGGEVFVLGDNRADSVDSRTFGPVTLRQIRGRLLFGIGSTGIRNL